MKINHMPCNAFSHSHINNFIYEMIVHFSIWDFYLLELIKFYYLKKKHFNVNVCACVCVCDE